MWKVNIKTIPGCIAYTAEYDIKEIMDFFDLESGENILYGLQHRVETENPSVTVPEIGEDYNFFEFPFKDNEDGTVHVSYFDMVDKMGNDNSEGAYRFVMLPEVRAAVMIYKGPYQSISEGYYQLMEWINNNGYETDGSCRISTIHGPWDRNDCNEYVNEVQIPVKEK